MAGILNCPADKEFIEYMEIGVNNQDIIVVAKSVQQHNKFWVALIVIWYNNNQ